MRVAAIYDVHGNLPALEAVLEDVDRHGADAVVVGGDVAWGPFPRQTVELIQTLENARFLRGNADREVATRAGVAEGLDDVVADINRWCCDELTDAQRSWLANLDEKAVADIEGIGQVLFCHGSPRSDEEILTAGTPHARLEAAVRDVPEAVVVCGHTHMQFDRLVGHKRVVNAGSVGLPYEREAAAYWTVLGPQVEPKKTTYDVDAALDAMARSGCPHVEMVFIDTLRLPPAQSEVIRQFEATAAQQSY